jgi:Family of unknown function (DUF6527)
MKAKPIIMSENGTDVQVEPALATHIKIHLPGPCGILYVPVIIKGQREGTGKWTWNGSIDKPTLKPSVLTQSGHFAPQFEKDDSCWCKYYKEHPEETPVYHCYRCHTWINDGKVQFLNDSTHEFKGQTLDLIDV